MKILLQTNKLLFVYIMLLNISRLTYGQVISRFISTNESKKYGIHYPSSQSIAKTTMPPFDLASALKEDSLEANQNLPFRFGKDREVDKSVLDQGTRSYIGDTILIYYQISSPGAYSINLIFDKFHLNHKQNGSVIFTRLYPSDCYIKETSGGTSKEYTFIGGNVYRAPVVAVTQSGVTTWYYLLSDHPGSITQVVNASDNSLAYQYSYNACLSVRSKSEGGEKRFYGARLFLKELTPF